MQYPQPNAPYPAQPPVREPRKFNAFVALFLSFFLGGLYRDVARAWRGFGFWYLILLMLIVSTPIALLAHRKYAQFTTNGDLTTFIDTCPTVTIDKGNVSIAEPEPYLWKIPKTGEVVLYVDTTGAFDLPAEKKAVAKLSKNNLYLRKSPTETDTYNLKGIDFAFDKVKLRQWVTNVGPYVGPSVFGLWFVGGVIFHILQILVYGLIGLIFCAMFGVRLNYPALLRLSMVALTPAMMIDLGLDLHGTTLPHAWWIFFGIEMLYLAFAVIANRSGQALPPTGFPVAAYPPGYGATGGGYPQQQPGYPAAQGGYAPAPPAAYPQQPGGYGAPPLPPPYRPGPPPVR